LKVNSLMLMMERREESLMREANWPARGGRIWRMA